jgi:excisionase family DNA binding protein
MFRVSLPTVRRYIGNGDLAAARIGRSYVIAGDDLEKFVAARKEAQDAEGQAEDTHRRSRARSRRRSQR